MAFKLTKAEQTRIEEISKRLEGKFEAITGIYNRAQKEIEDELIEYNEVREELRGVLEDIHAERTEEYDDKSDNWRDGDRGEATFSWLEKIEETMREVEDDLTIELDEIDRPEIFTIIEEGIPSEPEY